MRSNSYTLLKAWRNADSQSLPLYNPQVGDYGQSNAENLSVAELGYSLQTSDTVTIALQTETDAESHGTRTVPLRRGAVLLPAREMLIGHRPQAR
jgi:hypothetical protein